MDEYCEEPTNRLINKDPTNFHVVMQEERRIVTALSPDELKSLEEGEHLKGTQRELMEDLTMTTTGVLDYIAHALNLAVMLLIPSLIATLLYI